MESSGGSSTFSFNPNPVGTARDYATPQAFAVTRTVDGVAQTPVNITVAVFRKPIATPSGEVVNDVITIDYEIKSDALKDAVFAMYPASITVTNSTHVLNASMKMRRNLAPLATDEYLLMDRAGSTLGGATGDDEAMLSPSTQYKLYFAYAFANGTKLLELNTRSTGAATTLGAATSPHATAALDGSGVDISVRPTEELFKFAFIINNFDNTTSNLCRVNGTSIFVDGILRDPGQGKYRERIETIGSTTYTAVIYDNKPMTAELKESIELYAVQFYYEFDDIKYNVVNDNP